MQICLRNDKPLIAVLSLISSEARCAPSLPPGRASAAAVLPHSDLSSEIRVTQNKTKRGRGGWGTTPLSPPSGLRGLWWVPPGGAMIYRE